MINPDKVKKIAALGAALFLASDASSYITGHKILLEGGRVKNQHGGRNSSINTPPTWPVSKKAQPPSPNF